MEIKDIYGWSEKSLKEMTLNELSELEFILDHMPDGIDITINVWGDKSLGEEDETYYNLHDYIEERTKELFDVKREDYEAIVGKCFMSEHKNIVVKIVGLSDEKDYEFLFEQYEQCSDGWHHQDYIWLQETAKSSLYGEKYRKYCLTKQTDMNISQEHMFQLAKDGNLYVDTTCGGDYCIYTPIKPSLFEVIKAEVIENDGEYETQGYDV